MRLTGLSFEAIPPLDVPFRFYLTAPVFALLAAILMMARGEVIWLSRWMPETLALTHLLALGVIGMVMIGSLYQVIPVLCGSPIRIPKTATSAIHMVLCLGVLALGGAFLGWVHFGWAALLLGSSLGLFIFCLIITLVGYARGEQSRLPVLVASIAFACVIALGLVMVMSTYLFGWSGVTKDLTHLHAGVSVYGWVLLLIMAVSFQVIPMFHVTPVFPPIWRHGLVGTTCIALLALAATPLNTVVFHIAILLLVAVSCGYARVGLKCLAERKRKIFDATIRYWQWGYACLITSALLILLINYLPGDTLPVLWLARIEILLGILMALGFVLGVIQGMLLKIVPFLINLHLQNLLMNNPQVMQNPNAMMLIPDHYSLISKAQGRYQLYLYWLVLAAGVICSVMPVLTPFFGAAFGLNWLWVGYNMASAYRRYFAVRAEMLKPVD